MRVAKHLLAATGVLTAAALSAGIGISLGLGIFGVFLGPGWPSYDWAFVGASAFGGCLAGLLTAVVFRTRSIVFATAGPALFWSLLLLSPNPWLWRMPLVWAEATIAVGSAAVAWWIAKRLTARPGRSVRRTLAR